MLLEPILGREDWPVKVISRKSRGGLLCQRIRLRSQDGTYGGGTLFFLSFLRLNSIQSNTTRTIPPTTPPTIPPIAPPLNPDDVDVEDSAAAATVAVVDLEAEAEEETALDLADDATVAAEDDCAAEEACADEEAADGAAEDETAEDAAAEAEEAA